MPTSLQWLDSIRFDAAGLVPVLVQDADQHDMLMMAWMNAEALRRTVELGEMVFWSRSRQEYWHKGATSGNTMQVVHWFADCDTDCLLFQVRMNGPQAACHTGRRTCFHKRFHPDLQTFIEEGNPLFDPKQVYSKG